MRRFSSNITDQELCLLFKEAGEQYQPDHSPDEQEMQWLKLQGELPDRVFAAVQNKRGIYWQRWTTLIVLLLSFLFLDGPDVRSGHWGGSRPGQTEVRHISIGHTGYLTPQPREITQQPIDIARRIAVSLSVVSARSVLSTRPPVWMSPGRAPAVRTPNPEHPDTSRKKKARSRPAKWSIGLVAGTEWSMVEGKSNGRVGPEAGVILQYRFAQRWSVESGVLVADKIYAARPEDYHSPITYAGLYNINARCRVFDVPVNIRYDFLQRGNNQAFISTGLSSFWMQKEEYEYQFTTAGTPQKSERTLYNQNRHFLSIANISAGYEHTWKNLSFQVSPYLKLPLTGIGFGKVRLLSSGVQFSAKISF